MCQHRFGIGAVHARGGCVRRRRRFGRRGGQHAVDAGVVQRGPPRRGVRLLRHDHAYTTTTSGWIADRPAPPPARPGGRGRGDRLPARGYEVLYITTAPGPRHRATCRRRRHLRLAHRERVPDGRRRDPVGVGRYVHPDGGVSPAELDRLVRRGRHVDAAYTDNEDKAFAFKSAVPSERVFTLGARPCPHGATPVPGDDMVPTRPQVEAARTRCARPADPAPREFVVACY